MVCDVDVVMSEGSPASAFECCDEACVGCSSWTCVSAIEIGEFDGGCGSIVSYVTSESAARGDGEPFDLAAADVLLLDRECPEGTCTVTLGLAMAIGNVESSCPGCADALSVGWSH